MQNLLLSQEIDSITKEIFTENVFEQKKEYLFEKSLPVIFEEDRDWSIDSHDETKIWVSKIQIEGAVSFKNNKIQQLIKSFLNQYHSFSDIQMICQTIKKFYSSKGYILTEVVLPEQEINQGLLTILINEPQVEMLELKEDNNKYFFLERYFNKLIGKPFNYNQLLKLLLVIKDNTGYVVKTSLKKGEGVNSTRIVLEVEESQLLEGMIDINNYGSEKVSEIRYSFQCIRKNMTLLGDQLSLNYLIGDPYESMQYYQFIYGIQFPFLLMKLSLRVNLNQFKVLGEFPELKIEGKSSETAVRSTFYHVHSRTAQLYTYLEYEYKTADNYILDQNTSHDEFNKINYGVHFDKIDRYKGRNFIDLNFSNSVPDLFITNTSTIPFSRIDADNDFFKLNLSYVRLQKIPLFLHILFKLNGQYSTHSLPSSEQISLGGLGTLSGYKKTKIIGDQGVNASLSLNLPLKKVLGQKISSLIGVVQSKLYVEHGYVSLNKELTPLDIDQLTSAGFGMSFLFFKNLSVDLDIGLPLSNKELEDDSMTVFIRGVMRY